MERELVLRADEVVLEMKCQTPNCHVSIVFDPRKTESQVRNLCPSCGEQSLGFFDVAGLWGQLMQRKSLRLRVRSKTESMEGSQS